MKKKFNFYLILGVISLFIILGIIYFSTIYSHHERKDNGRYEELQELTDFDIEAYSWINLMPTVYVEGEIPEENKAFFLFTLNGISKDTFTSEYEIVKIILNDKEIEKNKISFEDENGFRFTNKEYKKNNSITLIIENKSSKQKYIKKFNISTEEAW